MLKLCNDWNENYKILINHAMVKSEHNSALKRASKVNQSLEDYLCVLFSCLKNIYEKFSNFIYQ
jgi:hypothetical protein